MGGGCLLSKVPPNPCAALCLLKAAPCPPSVPASGLTAAEATMLDGTQPCSHRSPLPHSCSCACPTHGPKAAGPCAGGARHLTWRCRRHSLGIIKSNSIHSLDKTKWWKGTDTLADNQTYWYLCTCNDQHVKPYNPKGQLPLYLHVSVCVHYHTLRTQNGAAGSIQALCMIFLSYFLLSNT